MSQWTHFLGLIRYDSFVCNVWPEPINKESEMLRECELVNIHWQTNVPGGSEGPLEIQTSQTKRGPTVSITGDLRDFGREDLGSVLDWCNDCARRVASAAMGAMKVLFVRDALLLAEVEFDPTLYIMRHNDKCGIESDQPAFVMYENKIPIGAEVQVKNFMREEPAPEGGPSDETV